MNKQEYALELFADYYQFYLQDEQMNDDWSNAWTDEAVKNLLALAPGVIGVGTVRNTDVPVQIIILDQEPTMDESEFDKVNTCEINIPSGTLVVAGCMDYFPDAKRISVEPGVYHAKVYYKNLDSLSEDGLTGKDEYRVVLWKKSTH